MLNHFPSYYKKQNQILVSDLRVEVYHFHPFLFFILRLEKL